MTIKIDDVITKATIGKNTENKVIGIVNNIFHIILIIRYCYFFLDD